MSSGNNKGDKMDTLVECINHAVREGFVANFSVEMVGGKSALKHIQDGQLNTFYSPESVGILSFYRFEGDSNPEDNSILYLIETVDGFRGTLVDSYGLHANPAITDFVKAVEYFQKEKLKNL